MNIWSKKNKISYETYLKNKKICGREYNDVIEQGESIVACGICDEYKRQNRFNMFTDINEKYRPFIKSGKLLSIISKIHIISIILFIFSDINIMYFSNTTDFYKLNIYSQFFLIFSLLSIIITHFIIRINVKIYNKERDRYNSEKKNPNWKRKQILKSLVK